MIKPVLISYLLPAGNYKPTPTHCFIKLLHDKGLLLRAFTQNIDSLEHEVRRLHCSVDAC
jgi:NAD-dependent deacetylase sirtuin 2